VSRFPTTRWTLIAEARLDESREARRALEELCAAYWRPLYDFVRARGLGAEDAQDVVQGFFAEFLARDDIRAVDGARGRFRSYLMGAVRNYLSDARDRLRALKRGGHVAHVPLELDFDDGERRYRVLLSPELDPERLFDRQWARTVLDRVLGRLRGDHVKAGQLERYEVLIDHVVGSMAGEGYADAASRLGLSEGAAKVAAHRLRKRYLEVLREEIADTVSDPREVDAEIRYLLQALGG
jgi:RNA polymerase sigma-70 factor (ECF subfamily)